MIEQSIDRRERRVEADQRQVRKLRTVAVTAGAFALVAVLPAVWSCTTMAVASGNSGRLRAWDLNPCE